MRGINVIVFVSVVLNFALLMIIHSRLPSKTDLVDKLRSLKIREKTLNKEEK